MLKQIVEGVRIEKEMGRQAARCRTIGDTLFYIHWFLTSIGHDKSAEHIDILARAVAEEGDLVHPCSAENDNQAASGLLRKGLENTAYCADLNAACMQLEHLADTHEEGEHIDDYWVG